jgi:hypothetical protein
MVALLALSAPPNAAGAARPLEVTVLVLTDVVPWRYPPHRELQFGEWLRDESLADWQGDECNLRPWIRSRVSFPAAALRDSLRNAIRVMYSPRFTEIPC